MPVSPLFAFFFTFQPTTTRTLSVDFYSFELFPLLLSLLPSLSILFFHDTKHQFLINSRGILVLLSVRYRSGAIKGENRIVLDDRVSRLNRWPRLYYTFIMRENCSGEEEESYVIKKLFSQRGYRVMRLHCARCPNDVSARHASTG